MHVVIKARHMEMTEALNSYVERKIVDPLRSLLEDESTRLEVELDNLGAQGDQSDKACRVKLSIPRRRPVLLTEVDSDLYRAIDMTHDRLTGMAKRELERQNRRSKAKRAAVRHRHQLMEEAYSDSQSRHRPTVTG